MTPQAKALRSAVAAAVGPGKVDAALRAVVEELGVQRSWPPGLRMTASQLVDDGFEPDGALVHETRTIAGAMSALLEASGVDHD